MWIYCNLLSARLNSDVCSSAKSAKSFSRATVVEIVFITARFKYKSLFPKHEFWSKSVCWAEVSGWTSTLLGVVACSIPTSADGSPNVGKWGVMIMESMLTPWPWPSSWEDGGGVDGSSSETGWGGCSVVEGWATADEGCYSIVEVGCFAICSIMRVSSGSAIGWSILSELAAVIDSVAKAVEGGTWTWAKEEGCS